MSILRLNVLRCASVVALSLLALFPARHFAASPNIVMIISDDQAWTDYGFMGHPDIQTPHLDQLASQSLLFTRGYVPTSLCRPSLATMITGLYPHEHKIVGNDPAGNKRQKEQYLKLREQLIQHIEQVPTLPRMLAKQNYLSMQSGKWWEGHHSRGGFTHGMTHGDPSRGGRHGDVGLKIGRKGMQEVFDFIDGAGDKPFFVWYAPFLPHTPHNPPQRLLDKYTADGRPVQLAKYYAMCEWFDETCGELLGYLDKKGLAENTIVVYVTDNGWIQRTPQSDIPKGWRFGFAPKSKRSPNEGGTRTPIMVRWPGHVKPRRDEKTLVSSIDLAPTILAACGLQPTDRMSGLNLLDDKALAARKTLYGEIFMHDVQDLDKPAASLLYRWCIEEDHKLIWPHQADGAAELYNLAQDPHETKNLAEAQPEKVEHLKQKTQNWWKVPAPQ